VHEDFIKQALIKRNDSLIKTEKLFIANKSRWFAAFSEHFQSICTEIVKQQSESSIPDISRLEYIMMYTNFINRCYIAEVYVFDDKLYLDKNQRVISEYDVSFLFIYFDELWDNLISLRKYYIGKVTNREISAFMIETLVTLREP